MMDMDLAKETALIEAILFLNGDPLDETGISEISGLSPETVKKALENLQLRYSSDDSGLELSRIYGGVIISPKKAYWDNLKEKYGKKNDGRLSRAAMETLSIVAYKQPITRSEIKEIRGVDPDNIIRFLYKEKKLIKEIGQKDVPGKPVQYGTTKEFLKVFRLNTIADLPKLDESEAERFELKGDT